MDGINGGTLFLDSETNAQKTFTTFGNAQMSTAQVKFGTASGLFDGTGDYITTPADNSFNFGTGDWTFDFLVNFASLSGPQCLLAYGSEAAGNDWLLRFSNSGAGQMDFFAETLSTVCQLHTGDLGLSTGTWYHFAFERFGSSMFMYLNGISQSLTITTALGSGSLPNGSAKPLTIGVRANNHDQGFNGYFDEFRISNIARYRGVNFTPPTVAYNSNASDATASMTPRTFYWGTA